MQTIGERLQQTRNRRGISIKQAAQDTKIRPDYLAFFEENHFEIPLPEIYRRGFLTLYAQYLKLDASEILAEYDNRYQKKGSARERREVYASIPTQQEKSTQAWQSPQAPWQNQAPAFEQPHGNLSGLTQSEPSESSSEESSPTLDPSRPEETIFAKPRKQISAWAIRLRKPAFSLSALGGIGLVCLILILGQFRWHHRSDLTNDASSKAPVTQLAQWDAVPTPRAHLAHAHENQENEATDSTQMTPDQDQDQAVQTETVEFEVTQGTCKLVVRQEADKAYLLNRTIKAGESAEIQKQGPIQVSFSEGGHLMIKKANKIRQIATPGPGTFRIL